MPSKLLAMLDGLDYPYAYRAFPVGESPTLPFICYYVEASENFKADDSVYKCFDSFVLELYTEGKNLIAESNVEQAFTEQGIVWEKSETYIDLERMYEIKYTFTMEV